MKKEETFKCIKDTPTGSYKAGVIYNDAMCDEFPEYFAKFKYTTHDGVDLYKGDKCCYLRSNGKISEMESFWSSGNELLFSTIEAAQAHIDENNKPKFEVGKVYKDSDNSNRMVFITNIIDEGAGNGYGFGSDGDWFSSLNNVWHLKRMVEATPAEWEAALIKEAERRGFKEGVKFIPVSKNALGDEFGTVGKMNENIFDYFSEEVSGGLASMKNWVMRHGKWASIIPDPEKDGRASMSFMRPEDEHKTSDEYALEYYKANSHSLIHWLEENNLIITKRPSHA